MKIYNYFRNIAVENICQVYRLKNIDETRNCLIEKINRNKLMSKKDKNIGATLNYIENFLILASTDTGCASISAFALIGIPIEVRSYEFCNWIKNLWNNFMN